MDDMLFFRYSAPQVIMYYLDKKYANIDKFIKSYKLCIMHVSSSIKTIEN